MDDKEFLDVLYQHWAKTTGAEDTYWMPEESEFTDDKNLYIKAVNEKQEKTPIGVFYNEVDADFITAVHGCLPDLVRRLHSALDEADRLDVERDEQEGKYAEAIIRQQELQQIERGLNVEIEQHITEAAALRGQLDALRSKAADVLWKTERPM